MLEKKGSIFFADLSLREELIVTFKRTLWGFAVVGIGYSVWAHAPVLSGLLFLTAFQICFLRFSIPKWFWFNVIGITIATIAVTAFKILTTWTWDNIGSTIAESAVVSLATSAGICVGFAFLFGSVHLFIFLIASIAAIFQVACFHVGRWALKLPSWIFVRIFCSRSFRFHCLERSRAIAAIPGSEIPRAAVEDLVKFALRIFAFGSSSFNHFDERGPHESYVRKVGQYLRHVELTRMRDFPVVWELFRFLLPEKIEKEAFEPAYNDMLADFQLAKRKYRTKGARKWLNFCFTLRTISMVVECLRLVAIDLILKFSFVSGLLEWLRKRRGPGR